jgi:hypothetical protein
MSFVTSIRTWRARRKERRAEKLLALGPKDTADADGRREVDKSFLAADPHIPSPSEWARHAGEEGKKQY